MYIYNVYNAKEARKTSFAMLVRHSPVCMITKNEAIIMSIIYICVPNFPNFLVFLIIKIQRGGSSG